MDTTRRKVMCVAIVLALLSVAVVVVMNTPIQEKNNEINIIAQVNENGSSLIIKNSLNPDDYRSYDEEGNLYFTDTQVNNWKGKVICTPGVTTIQHTMLVTMITKKQNEGGLGLEWDTYAPGKTGGSTVLLQPNVYNKGDWETQINEIGSPLLGYIIWEYIVSEITADHSSTGGQVAIKSKDMDEGHACCIIAANAGYLDSNWDSTVRFLKAYIRGVEDVNRLIAADPESQEYKDFIKWASEDYTGKSEAITRNALNEVTYTYGDSTAGGDTLGRLRANITKFVNGAGIADIVLSQGYSSVEEFANQIVNDRFVNDAKAGAETDVFPWTVKVASIEGDIHQIALHWANKNGYFKDEFITLDIAFCKNGSAVATSLQNGEANVGFMGVPPITLVVANSELNPAIHYMLSGTITDNGTPVEDAQVRILASNNLPYTCSTNKEGTFSVSVIKGTYAISDDYVIQVLIDGNWEDVDIKRIERVSGDTTLEPLEVHHS